MADRVSPAGLARRVGAWLIAPMMLALSACVGPLAGGGDAPLAQVGAVPSYADLAAYADEADLVILARAEDVAELEPERAPGVPPTRARLYVEAATQSLLAGPGLAAQELMFLADVPRDADGKAARIKGAPLILFARTPRTRPGELQLVAPDAMLIATPEAEARTRAVLRELVAPDAPPRVVGVRDAISVPGNLAGESQTQIFLRTADGSPATINVIRRPGMQPRWGASFSDIVNSAATPPARDTLAWYRLACSLPEQLTRDQVLSENASDYARALEDYRLVKADLGPCTRNRG
jgi:hypothetical protein